MDQVSARSRSAASPPFPVDRKTGAEHYRDWVPGQPLDEVAALADKHDPPGSGEMSIIDFHHVGYRLDVDAPFDERGALGARPEMARCRHELPSRRLAEPSDSDLRSFAQHRPRVLHEQEQVTGVLRARLELQSFIPSPRLVVLGMDEKRPNAGDVGGRGGPEQSVLDKRLAQAASLRCRCPRKTAGRRATPSPATYRP